MGLRSDTSTTDATCIEDTEPSQNEFPIGLTLNQIFIIVGGVCAIVSVVNVMLVWLSHLRWRSNLPQQRQLMRIVLLPGVFAIFSWISVYDYSVDKYVVSIPKIYETYAVACFFQFMLHVLTNTEDESKRYEFMAQAERRTIKKSKRIHDKGSLRWYKVRSMLVFQSPFITLLGVIATEIIAAKTCDDDDEGGPDIGKLIIEATLFLSVVNAIVSMANIYARFKFEEFKTAHIFRKFISFKGMITIFVHQQLVLTIINFTNAVEPTHYMSQADFDIGIPAFLILCECCIFSFIFFFSLSGLNYRQSAQTGDTPSKQHKKIPISAYLLGFFLPTDIVVQTGRAMRTFIGLFKGKRRFDYTNGTGTPWSPRDQNAQKPGSGDDSEESQFVPNQAH